MALNKIPDSMLSKFTCSKCKRFVTMAPIAIEDNGQISCGNCTDWTVPKVRCNLLESLATLYAFPCKYKQAGCPEYLLFDSTLEHESNCEYHTFACPIGLLNNNCKWEGTATSMLRHYKRQHPQFSTNYPNFKITLNDEYEKYYMIEIDHILLLLQIKSSISQGKLWFNTVYIGDPANANFIRFRINLSCKDVSKQVISLQTKGATGIDKIKMDVDKCTEISKDEIRDVFENVVYIHCNWNIYIYSHLADTIKIDVDEEEDENQYLVEAKSRNTTCPNCNVLMVPPIYRCETFVDHVTCNDCKGYYNECKMCQKNDVIFNRADNLEIISKLKHYHCRWAACNEIFTFQNIRAHEQQCSHRIFKCPKCNVWSGDAKELFVHFKTKHPKVIISHTNPLFFNAARFVPGYLLIHNELFLLDVDFNPRRQFTFFSVTYLGLPSQFNDWEFNLATRGGRPVQQIGNEANVVTYKPEPTSIPSFKFTIERKHNTK